VSHIEMATAGRCRLELDSLANATSFARHLSLRAAMVDSIGRAGSREAVVVLNTIDKHYTDLIASWKAMVSAAAFEKRIFVVAMDEEAAIACRAADVPYFWPHATEHAMPSSTSGACDRSRRQAVSTAKPGSYHRTKIQGKQADTRVLPPDLPSWKMHVVWASLSLGWKVLFSESDVLWIQGGGLAPQLLQSTDEDFAPMRHPMTPVWNFGFFFAQGGRSSSFFECGVRMWERKQLLARHAGDSRTDIGTDQRFLWDLWRKQSSPESCGPLRIKKLAFSLYPTCRDWVGSSKRGMLVAHVTYCHRLSMLLSSEDVCKRKVMNIFYLAGGLSADNLTSAAWNKRLEAGC